MRGRWLATHNERLEDASIEDFLDVVYSYSIDSPDLRFDMRTAMLKYMFDIKEETDPEMDEDMTFEGFSKNAMSLLDELDTFEVVG